MADAFEEAMIDALSEGADTFSFPYEGEPGTGPAGVVTGMTCLVLLMPTPMADLMVEGLPAVRASLATLAVEMVTPPTSGIGSV